MGVYFKNKVLIVWLLCLPFFCVSQSSIVKPSHYNWFDSRIGETNLEVYNGLEYVEKHRMLNGKHKFFDNPNFTKGLVVFNDQPYYNLRLKYDVFEDNLLLRYSDEPKIPIVLLDKFKVSEFIIDNHHFENLKIETNNGEIKIGFYELLVNSNTLKLYKKHQKKIQTKTNENIRYYEFKDQNFYVILKEGVYYEIKKSDNLSKIFPNQKEFIKNKEQEYKSVKKNNPDKYLRLIFEDLSKKLSKAASGI